MGENGQPLRGAQRHIILYYGTFEPYQGLDLLVDGIEIVIACSTNVQFILVGGTPDQVARLRKKVANKGLEDYVLFPGTVQPQEIPRYIAMADILVSPRIGGRNTPLKIYSYLRSGKAIVATNHPSHTQVLNPDTAMLTESRPEAIAEGIITLLKDPPLRERLALNASRFAEEHFRWENVREKIRLMYDAIANPPTGRPPENV